MKNAFHIVRDFEDAVKEYTGAPYCVAVNSCTNALFLCLKYTYIKAMEVYRSGGSEPNYIEIPKKTYIGVAQSILGSGYKIRFRDHDWYGEYRLSPHDIWDSAKLFTSEMWYSNGEEYKCHDIMGHRYKCTSHHWNKTLGLQQGGCILHNNKEADIWFRKARFDGRTEGAKPSEDLHPIRGWHMYMSPEVAALGLVKLMHLPKHNYPMSRDDYPDLSTMEIFT